MALATAPTAQNMAPAGMSPMERRHLGALERRIAAGLQTFREVGASLLEIRDQRLYRETHGSFEAYCGERWQLNRQRAYQLIDSARVVKALGDPEKLRNEAQARELAPLSPDDAKAVWVRVSAVSEETGQPVTAPMIRRVRSEVVAPTNARPEPPSATDRLLQDMARLTAAFARWRETKPNAAERRRVAAAYKELVAVLS